MKDNIRCLEDVLNEIDSLIDELGSGYELCQEDILMLLQPSLDAVAPASSEEFTKKRTHLS